MSGATYTRRDFLARTGAGATVYLLGDSLLHRARAGEPEPRPLFTRRDIGSLPPNGPEIASLRNGVSEMKSRDDDDPTSWIFQANIHGATMGSHPGWNQCQHGSFFFLSWHRMYLYFFERILREASGDAELALPYWNYTNPSDRALPVAFREPGDASNPLFVSQRNFGINDGYLLPASSTSYATAFGFTNFTAPAGSSLCFGGQTIAGPTHFTGPHGQLERQPHDVVHVMLGGSDGWMSDPNWAARDPIFWLHHANIDRLWKRWLDQGGGRTNPTGDGVWMNTPFSFFDEQGQAVQMNAGDILDTELQLGYRYDDDPPPAARFAGSAAAAAAGEAARREPPPREVLARAARPAYELGDQPVTVRLELDDAARRGVERSVAPAAAAGTLVLTVEGLDFEKTPGVTYEVYLNLPDDEEPDPQGPHYVGNLSFFGLKPHAHAEHEPNDDADEHAEHGPSNSFPISNVVRALQARDRWQVESLTTTFVERGLIAPEGKPPAVEKGIKATFSRLSLSLE